MPCIKHDGNSADKSDPKHALFQCHSLLTILATLSLASGSSFAGCGKIDTDKGTLKAMNNQSKTITIEVAGKEVQRTLTPSSKATGIRKLIGKRITVTSTHGKVQAVKEG